MVTNVRVKLAIYFPSLMTRKRGGGGGTTTTKRTRTAIRRRFV
jgi:hypothetical protein